jgi:mRNA interferase HicA
VKRRDLAQHLSAHGCELFREGGRHTVFINPANRYKSTVPRHNEIKNALVRKICRDLGIPNPFEKATSE